MGRGGLQRWWSPGTARKLSWSYLIVLQWPGQMEKGKLSEEQEDAGGRRNKEDIPIFDPAGIQTPTTNEYPREESQNSMLIKQ